MEQEYKYMVATRCFTFNHAPYIEDAMNGFAMQETTFPVVTLIVDDASTDGEPEVIRKYLAEHFQSPYRVEETEYANIICAKHKTNANCDFVVFLLKYNHYSIKKPKLPYLSEWNDKAKYHALCEGDDYWIAADKLSKQVEFLEQNDEYGLVYTNHYNKSGDRIIKVPEKGNTNWEDIIFESGIATLTTCFRSDLFFKYDKEVCPSTRGWLMGDAPLWKYFSLHSKVKFFHKYTSVYRILPESASHSKSKDKILAFEQSGYEIRTFFVDHYVKDIRKAIELRRKIKEDHINKLLVIHLAYKERDIAKQIYINNKSSLSLKSKSIFYARLAFTFIKPIIENEVIKESM